MSVEQRQFHSYLLEAGSRIEDVNQAGSLTLSWCLRLCGVKAPADQAAS